MLLFIWLSFESKIECLGEYGFTIGRLLMLSAIYGAAITQFVYGMEICPPKFRMPLGISANFVFTAGIGLLAPIGYAGTNWGNMSIVVALLPLLILVTIPFTEESFRWYHSKGKIAEAKESLLKFSKRCGAPISEKNIDEILKTENDDEDIKQLTGKFRFQSGIPHRLWFKK